MKTVGQDSVKINIERAALAVDVAAGRVFPISVDDGDYYRAWLDSHTEE